MSEKTHWKKFHNYDFLGAYSLEDGNDLTLTISNVSQEGVKGQSGKEETCMIVYFEEESKGMVCNRTNAKTIQTLNGSPYIEDWKGQQVTLYVEKGIKAFGTVTDALRIREVAPKKEIDPAQGISKLNGCLDLGELKDAWSSFNKDEKNNGELIKLKESLKNTLPK